MARVPQGRAGAGGGRGAGGRGAGAGGRAGGGGARPVAAAPPAATPPAAAQTPAAEGATPAAGTQPAERRKDPGSDLILRNLTTGQDVTIPEVTEFAWDKTGTLLAYAVSSTDATKDGVFVRRTADGSVTPLKAGRGIYKSLSFDDAGQQIAFLSDTAEYDKRGRRRTASTTGRSATPAATEVVSASTRGMPSGMVVSDNFAPRFSEDGARLYPRDRAAARAARRSERRRPRCRVDLWSSRDAQIQPMQQVRAAQERNRNYRAVVHLSDKRLVQLATPDLPNVNPGSDPLRALGTSDVAYQKEMSWDTTYNDVYLVDLKNGQRKKVLEHFNGANSMSPGGNYLLYFDEPSGHWFTYQISTGTARQPHRAAAGEVLRRETRHAGSGRRRSASAGWTDGDKSVLLNDQFDIWEIRPDGTNARMVTNGEGRKQRTRLPVSHRSIPDARTVPGEQADAARRRPTTRRRRPATTAST